MTICPLNNALSLVSSYNCEFFGFPLVDGISEMKEVLQVNNNVQSSKGIQLQRVLLNRIATEG